MQLTAHQQEMLDGKHGETMAKVMKTLVMYGETKELRADSVILSVGYNPAPIAKKSKHVHVIGDAQNVGNLRTVIWGAWDVAMKI